MGIGQPITASSGQPDTAESITNSRNPSIDDGPTGASSAAADFEVPSSVSRSGGAVSCPLSSSSSEDSRRRLFDVGRALTRPPSSITSLSLSELSAQRTKEQDVVYTCLKDNRTSRTTVTYYINLPDASSFYLLPARHNAAFSLPVRHPSLPVKIIPEMFIVF